MSFVQRGFGLFLAVTAMACFSAPAASGQTLKDLQPAKRWEAVANGVWKAQFGDLSKEVRYTDLAAAPPKINRINQMEPTRRPKILDKIRFKVNSDHKVQIRIPTEKEESIFGYGLQFDGTRKNGKILELKVDHFNRGGGATHAPVPFFVSSKGYGVFFNTAKFLKVYNQLGNRRDSDGNPPEVDRNPPKDEKQPGRWLAQPPSDAVEAYLHGDGVELIVFSGSSIQEIVAKYNLFSGGGTMPPLWGLGFWHRVPSKFSAQQTAREIEDFKKHNIPLDVIGLEPGWQTKSYPCTFQWQKKRFPNPEKFTKDLLADGIRLNLWENPYISKHASIYPEMLPLSGSHMVWLGIVPDYYLPEARKILVDQHAKDHIDIGISGYKIDEVDGYDKWLWPDHATFPSGKSAEVMRQTYGMLVQRMLYQDLFRKKNLRTYNLVRASNGAASAHPFVLYSDSYGHDQYITGISSSSLSGVLWCPEIRSAGHPREWINRMHTVCFSPMAMLNAWASGTKPWSFPGQSDAVRRTIQLRMRLLPYFYTAFSRYHFDGIPPVRSMLLETGRIEGGQGDSGKLDGETDPYGDGQVGSFKEDNSLFMFGPDILVAPFSNRQIQRKVRLPKGNWYDFYSGKFVGNGQEVVVTAKQLKDMPPLFVKEGAVIPMLGKSVNRTKDAYGAPLEIRHYGTQDGSSFVFEDDGDSYNYEKGQYVRRHFKVKKNSSGQFKMEERQIDRPVRPLFGKATFRQMTR